MGNLTQKLVLGSRLEDLDQPNFHAADRAIICYRPAVMASTHADKMAVRQFVEVPADRHKKDSKHKNHHVISIEMQSEQRIEVEHDHEGPVEAGEPPSQDNCDSNHHGADSTITISSTSKLAGQMVAPFLAKHIPEQYAPLGVQHEPTTTSIRKDPNTKYCYRHRPDSKCRRTADEPRMENLQRVGSPQCSHTE